MSVALRGLRLDGAPSPGPDGPGYELSPIRGWLSLPQLVGPGIRVDMNIRP